MMRGLYACEGSAKEYGELKPKCVILGGSSDLGRERP